MTKRVLIVEDELDICELLQTLIHKINPEVLVESVHDGFSGSEKLRIEQYDLVFMDLNLPRKTGISIIRDFPRFGLNKVENVVVFSGTLDKGLFWEASTLGIKHVVLKGELLKDIIKKLIIKANYIFKGK